jgi:nucleoside-diphosphate-sugar epimerase
MKVLITGATGFIGKRLSERLAQEGHEVICTGRMLSKLDKLLNRVKAVCLDIEDPAALRDILSREKPEIVFHCAALVNSSSLDALMRINRDGTRNVLDACVKEGIERVVYLSSIAVISGNPQTPLTDDLPYSATNRYGESKIEAEKIALSYRKKGLKISIIRPVMVYGEHEPHLLGLLVRLIRWRLLPIVGLGSNRLQLVCVDNVVDVMMLALGKNEAYDGTYIIADKEPLSTREFFEFIAKTQGAKPPFTISEKLISFFDPIPFIGNRLSFFKKDRIYSIQRIKERLGYVPEISVYDGLKKAVLSYGKNV